jgi:LysR family transcriptional regulator, transcriptional activator for bauABCD operon
VRRLLDVDLRLVRIFRAVAEARGIAGAEPVLALSQSRISGSLADLEARLGVRLCRRGRSGFALTEAGVSVYEASHDLFESVDRFCNRAGAVSANLKRRLRLASVDAVVSNESLPLSRALLRFRRQLPSVIIDFYTAGPDELERLLIAGSRDIGVMPSRNRRSDLDYVPLAQEKQSLYCGRGHSLFGESDSELSVTGLVKHAFVARGYLHSDDLKRIGHRLAEATVETMEAQLILILSGEFIGYLPAHYAQAWVARRELRCLGDEDFSYDSAFFAVSQPSSSENPLVRRFLTLLMEEIEGTRASTREVVPAA